METNSSIHTETLRLFGSLDDHRIKEIENLDPSLDDLEVTSAYLAGMDDIMGKERHPLTGRAAKIYEIVIRDEPSGEEDYPRP
jgi:hypothetical protein